MNFFNRSTPLPYVATYGFQCVTDTNCQEVVQVLVGGKLRCDAGKSAKGLLAERMMGDEVQRLDAVG